MVNAANGSRIIKHDYTENINFYELNYRETIQPNEVKYNDVSKWIDRIDQHRTILEDLYDKITFKGNILELGAGSCWFGSELSRLGEVREIYCLDMSEFILEKIAPFVMSYLHAKLEKITRVVGDFNKLDFPDRFFNFVVFDATLHHIPRKTFGLVLREIKRVLRVDGQVIAIKEPFLPEIPVYARYKRNKFGLHERKYGVTENIYTRKEWKIMFEEAGFRPEFIPNIGILGNGIIEKLIKNTPLEFFFFILSPKYFIRLVRT